jgi:DNA mismatch repair protein MutS
MSSQVQALRHHFGPVFQVLGRVAAHRGIQGGARRGVNAHDVPQRHGEKPVRVVFAEMRAGHEGQPVEVVQGLHGRRIDAVAPHPLPVKGDAAKSAVQGALKTLELALDPFVKVTGRHGSFPPLVKPLVILAQIGSYVPCEAARIGLVDKIFTRVGAVDDLSLGQSTFMVEMNETAFILNSATEKSLILLDEIGRGTSTYDGVAIAWSVAQYLAEKIKARTIFATHYHELNVMSSIFEQIKNYRVTISENDGEIIFLRKVIEGSASKSYGIQVAKMAGLPQSVLKTAQEIMSRMQADYSKDLSQNKRRGKTPALNVPQLSLVFNEDDE